MTEPESRETKRPLRPGERRGPDGKIRYSASWLGDRRCPVCGALLERGLTDPRKPEQTGGS